MAQDVQSRAYKVAVTLYNDIGRQNARKEVQRRKSKEPVLWYWVDFYLERFDGGKGDETAV